MAEGPKFYVILTTIVVVLSLAAFFGSDILQNIFTSGTSTIEDSLQNQRSQLIEASETIPIGERRSFTFSLPGNTVFVATNEYCDSGRASYFSTELNRVVNLVVPEECRGNSCVCICENSLCEDCIRTEKSFLSQEAYEFLGISQNQDLEEQCPSLPIISTPQNYETDESRSNLVTYELFNSEIGLFVCQGRCNIDDELLQIRAETSSTLVDDKIDFCIEKLGVELNNEDSQDINVQLNQFDPMTINYDKEKGVLYGLGLDINLENNQQGQANRNDIKLIYYEANLLSSISKIQINSEYFEHNKEMFIEDVSSFTTPRNFNIISLPQNIYLIDKLGSSNDVILTISNNNVEEAPLNEGDIIEIDVNGQTLFYDYDGNKLYDENNNEIFESSSEITGRYQCSGINRNSAGGEIKSININEDNIFLSRKFTCSITEQPPDYEFKSYYIISTMDYSIDPDMTPIFMYNNVEPSQNLGQIYNFHNQHTSSPVDDFVQDSYDLMGIANNGEEVFYLFYVENFNSNYKYHLLKHRFIPLEEIDYQYDPSNFNLVNAGQEINSENEYCEENLLDLSTTKNVLLFHTQNGYQLRWRDFLRLHRSEQQFNCVYQKTDRGIFSDIRVNQQENIQLRYNQRLSLAKINGNTCWLVDNTI